MPPTTAPPNTSAAAIRQAFIDYFVETHGHAFAPSSPVVPHDDPTLLFTNAGMNQFKDVFLGQGTRDYRRAANTQKCIRAGGKHNDLEDVGRDLYHHTFFEMLGNWSFGDYFKAEAIEWAWTLMTEVWGLDPERLYVTVFEGCEAEGTAPDTEAEDLWKRYVPECRISRWSKKDNFWEMGETGPCGPCSEIHYDATPDKSGGDLVNLDDPDVIELWNLVFIQYNRTESGELVPLPAKHVDTGMGLERIVRVLQGKNSNYATDLWTPIFDAIREHSGAAPYGDVLDDPVDIAYRVIADHIRCLTVALADGARPGNEGRGYVLRRILRRGVRMAHQTLGVEGPMLCKLVASVADSLGDAFPEIRAKQDEVATIVRDEEDAFLRTIDRGLVLFGNATLAAIAAAKPEVAAADGVEPESITPEWIARHIGVTPVISADDAFKLHDTYGFPIDLTRVMAEERGLAVDESGFAAQMDAARERSRAGGEEKTDLSIPPEALAELEHALKVEPTTVDDVQHGRPLSTTIRAIWNGRDFDDVTQTDDTVALILDRTNHYAEAGGQIGDTGTIECDVVDMGDGPTRLRTGKDPRGFAEFRVDDTQRCGNYVLHIGRLIRGKIRCGDKVTVTLTRSRRQAIRANHTATHLLNHALRQVIGDEVDQRGSLVADDRLRFDFTAPKALSDAELNGVERLVNASISMDLKVHADAVSLEDAKSIHGVRAVFGERYPDPVRVVSIGVDSGTMLADPNRERWREHSVEFCGGTHLNSTGDAKRLVVVKEEALAAGIRRITALTGPAAMAARAAGQELASRAFRTKTMSDDELLAEYDEITSMLDQLTIGAVERANVLALLEEISGRVKSIRKAARASAREGVTDQARVLAESIQGQLIIEEILGADMDALRSAIDVMKARRPEVAVMLFSPDEDAGKVSIIARVPENLIGDGLKAGDWVREAAKACGGGGGGRPDMAQAGGKDPSKIDDAIAAARAYAEGTLA